MAGLDRVTSVANEQADFDRSSNHQNEDDAEEAMSVEDESELESQADLESMAASSVMWDNDTAYDEKIDVDEEQKMLERFRLQRENEQFPDEIDTPLDTPARIRFMKYRGLKSFRTSSWDPKENLPADYARVFQFEDFRHTKKRVLNAEREGALHGWHVRVHLLNVPSAVSETIQQQLKARPVVLHGLLEHEQRMSVLHFAIRKHASCTVPIKSKDRLVFQVGHRRFMANPIFSQHTNGDKHKFERYLPSDACTVATVYAPIMYPPASVLVTHPGDGSIVASGSLLGVDPDRIVAKRVVLSGHPAKIQKKTVVVRYMFFNPGTHGHMKCVFDGPVTQQDTVMLNLYKRVFPRWTYQPVVDKIFSPDVHEMEN